MFSWFTADKKSFHDCMLEHAARLLGGLESDGFLSRFSKGVTEHVLVLEDKESIILANYCQVGRTSDVPKVIKVRKSDGTLERIFDSNLDPVVLMPRIKYGRSDLEKAQKV